MSSIPTTLQEAIKYFADPATLSRFTGRDALAAWSSLSTVSIRKNIDFSKLAFTLGNAKVASKQYTAKLGTIFEDSPIKLDKWFCAHVDDRQRQERREFL